MKWETVSFEDGVSSRGSGASGLPQSQWEEGGKHPVIGQGAEAIEGRSNRTDLLLTPNPAVVLYGGHTRRAKYVDHPFVPGPNVKILEPKARLDAKFLFYFLAQLPIESRGYADHFPEVRRCSIPVPPLSEQRQIAGVLDRAEALRAKRRATLAQLDTLTQSLFLDLFGNPATNPKCYRRSSLESLIRQDDTINYGVVQPGDELSEGVPLIRVGDLIEGQVRHSDLKRIAPSIEAAYKRSRLRGDEVLLVCVGATAGLVALADESVKGFNIARAIARIPLAETADRNFIAEFLRAEATQRRFQSELRTVAQPTLNIKQICELPVLCPPWEEQREFARRVAAVEKLKAAQRASLAEMDALFASLQHRAFRGEL